MDSRKLYVGWAQAFFSVLVLWGINNVVLGYSSQILNANYLIYTCASFLSCAFCLLIVGGRGPLVKETLRSIDTWAFGFIMLIGYVLTLTLFSYVTSTEGSLLQRISLMFSVLVSWIFLSRTPTKGQLVGVLFVLAGIAVVCAELPEKDRGIIYLLMFLEGLALTGRVFIAEIHRPHKQAMNLDKDPRAKARVVGFVMFIISTFFLFLAALLALLQTYAPLPFESNILPTLNSFVHAPSIIAGLIAGVLLLAPLRVIEFSSANIIKTENFLAIAALSSAATYFWEWLLQPLTGMSLKSFTNTDLVAGIIITLGSLITALSQARKSKGSNKWEAFIEYASQDLERIDDSREMVACTLEHFAGDVDKTADALGVDKSAVLAVLSDSEKVLAFKADILKEVVRQYRRNVATSDALTGLANRAGFMASLKGAAYEAEVYSVLFIDLNKFKPVNDTYGHDAGDFILKGVAERLSALFPKRALVTRLGGDEFAILLLDKTKEQAEAEVTKIKNTFAEPFNFNDTSITIGGSVGIATYPEDGDDPETLLKLADEGMYKEKNR